MRVFKILGLTLASIIGLLVIAGVIVASVFDPNDYKDYVTDFVEERTGRSLSIDSDLELSIFPWLAVETGGVTLGNNSAFGEQPFATIDQLSARVRLVPLLSREIEVGTVSLDGVVLNLSVDADGNNNWDDLLSGSDTAEPVAAEDAGDAPAINDLEIAGVTIRNGRILWREDNSEARYIISDLNVETGAINAADPIDASLSLSLLDVASQNTFDVQLSAEGEMAAGATNLRDVTADVRVLDSREALRAEGQLRIASASISDTGLVEVGVAESTMKLTEPPMGPDEVDVSAAWQRVQFDQGAQTLTVAGLVTRVNEIGATVELTSTNVIDAPNVSGNISVPQFRAAELLTLLDLEAPQGLNPDELGNAELNADFATDINTGAIAVSNVRATLLGMQVTGAAEMGTPAGIQANLAIPQFTPNESFFKLAEGYAPETINLRAIESLAFTGSVDYPTDGPMAIDDFELKVGDGALSGSVRIAESQGGSRYSGSIKSSRLASDFVEALMGDLLTETLGAAEIGSLTIDTGFDYEEGSDRATLNPFAIDVFGLSARGNVAITNVTAEPTVSGRANFATFAPGDFLRRFGQPVPQTSDPTVFQQARITGQFLIDADHGDFNDLVIELDESRVSGELSVNDFQNPSYEFALAIDQVDVDRYLPPSAEEAEEGERAAGDIELSAEPLQALRLAGTASVGNLKLANLRFQDVSTGINIGDGTATIDSARAKLYGGEFAGGILVDATGEKPSMRLQGQATSLALEPLIEALVGDANFSGTGSFDIDLTGTGATVTESLQSAAGKMSFTLRDGAITGFNLSRTLCAAYNATQQAGAPPDLPEVTPYSLIQADAAVSDGIASTPAVVASTSFVDVTGDGRISLATQQLDYRMDAKLTNPIDIPGCNALDRHVGSVIPFTISGTVTDATILPDFSQLLRNAIRERAEDSLRDRLEDRLRDLL